MDAAHPQHVAWTAATRAVRTPSRADDDVRLLNRTLPPGEFFSDSPPILAYNTGNRSFKSERLRAFELGYRLHPRPGLSLDLATFYNDYEDLRTGKLDTLIRRDEVIRPQNSTATGTALQYVNELIQERYPDQSVYIALVTDGEPTTGGEHQGALCDAQEHAEIKAAQLPENAKLVQFALAPIDPADTSRFDAYLRNINSVTEKNPYGQTIVLLRKREDNLAYLVLGRHQKIKQIQGWNALYGAES